MNDVSHVAPSDELKALAALTALNAMFAGGHFNICTIDRAAKLLAVHVEPEAYNLLHALHCVNWKDMPPDLRAEIPRLVQQTLSQGGHTFRFDSPGSASGVAMVVDRRSDSSTAAQSAPQPAGRRPLLQRLMLR